MPEMRIAAVRHAGAYHEIGKAFERLGATAGPAGLFQQPGAVMIGVYYDDPETTPQDQLRSAPASSFRRTRGSQRGSSNCGFPRGVSRVPCTGSYEELGDVWARLKSEVFETRGHRIGARPSYEIYRNTPMEVPKEELRTEIHVPVE